MSRGLLAPAVLALASCSLFTSLEGYREDIVIEAGAPDATDGLGGDAAGQDGSTVLVDGSPDSAAVPFCTTLSPAPFMCSDFDDGQLPGPWSAFGADMGGTITIENGALVMSVPSTGGATAKAYVWRTLPGTRASIDIDVDVLVEQMGGPHFDIVQFTESNPYELGLELGNGMLYLDEDRPNPDGGSGDIEIKTAMGSALPTQKWTHVKWSLRASGNGGTSEVFVDGQSRGVLAVVPRSFATSTVLELGESFVQPTAPLRVRYDNFVMRIQ